MQTISGSSLRFSLIALILLASALGTETSQAQFTSIDHSKNAGPAMTTYEQGIANIIANAAARPAAVKPITIRNDSDSRREVPALGRQPQPTDNMQPAPTR